MSRWPHDDPASLKAFYGDPGRGEPGRQLVPIVPPFKMYYDGKPIKAIQFHKKAAPALKAALDEIWEHYGQDQATIDKLGISKYAGSYNPRKIRGSATRWSNHAYGAAIDLNAEQNGFGAGKGTMPEPVVAAFKAQGALWGGDYRGRTDPMHFEFCSRDSAVGLLGDMDSDAVAHDEQDEPEEAQPSWLKRKWRGLTGWLSGGSAMGGLAFFDWRVFVALLIFLFIVAVAFIWFMGPKDVRSWVKAQVT